MVLIMVTAMFPPEKGMDVQKKYNEIQSKFLLPSFLKQKKLGMRWNRVSMKVVAVYEVEKEKESDALSFIYRYETEFAGIEGYSNEIETLLTIEEMPSLGVS